MPETHDPAISGRNGVVCNCGLCPGSVGGLPVTVPDAFPDLAALVPILLGFPGSITDRAEGMSGVSQGLREEFDAFGHGVSLVRVTIEADVGIHRT